MMIIASLSLAFVPFAFLFRLDRAKAETPALTWAGVFF